jgi:hypothetical protein
MSCGESGAQEQIDDKTVADENSADPLEIFTFGVLKRSGYR